MRPDLPPRPRGRNDSPHKFTIQVGRPGTVPSRGVEFGTAAGVKLRSSASATVPKCATSEPSVATRVTGQGRRRPWRCQRPIDQER
jgi:hypothetical protein